MSSGTVCRDHGREHWRVVQRRQRQSAFDGYRVMASDWSQVVCFGKTTEGYDCYASWRTKAAYVSELPDAPAEWWR